MTLTEQILNYISQVGDQEAASFFGKATSTMRAWVRTGNIPLKSVEKFLEQIGGGAVQSAEPVVSSDFQNAAIKEIESLRGRVQHIEDFLAQTSAQQPAAPIAPAKPSKQWYEADPTQVGFSSFVRPGATVATQATLQTPAPTNVNPSVRKINPADTWLTPIKRTT